MNAAELAKHFDIPPARIRKWISRGRVRRNTDGTVDIHSLIAVLDPDLADQVLAHRAT